MDERFVRKLLVPSFLIIILSTAFFYEFKCAIDVLFFKKKHMLIIGILSAPENFQQRQSIRKTWLNLLSEISGSYYFILGNEICDVPLIDRPDRYTCINKPFKLPGNATSDTEFASLKINTQPQNHPGFIGFGFYVRSKIIIHKLGILKEVIRVFNSEVQVKLVSGFDNKVLASVTFSPDLVSQSSSQFLIKAIKPVALDESFEAFVRMEAMQMDSVMFPSCNFTQWENEVEVINYIQLWQEGSVMPQPFVKKSCSYVYMKYTLGDFEKVKHSIDTKNKRLAEWNKLNKKLSQKLKNESTTFKDLMFLDVVDVYRNLSLKMIKFYKRIVETEYFHYVLKTDDDSFIDLMRVHHQLKDINKKLDEEITQSVGYNVEPGVITKLRLSKFWWWSFFKEYWKVQHSGKWRDDLYQSAAYPTFPCGGGYVVNKGIADYIASNINNLNYFQGEDVSMGIWLSALHVIQHKTPKLINAYSSNELQKKIVTKFSGKKSWEKCEKGQKPSQLSSDSCEWTCNNQKISKLPLCNKVQLSVEDMYDTWTKYITNGFL